MELTWANALMQGGFAFILVAVLYALVRMWWVPGWIYKELKTRYEALEKRNAELEARNRQLESLVFRGAEVAADATNVGKDAVELAKKRAEKQRGETMKEAIEAAMKVFTDKETST